MKRAPLPTPLAPDTAPAREASSGLDLDAVRGLFEKLAKSSLGARAVRELAPRSASDARRALNRAAEMAQLVRARDVASFAGVVDLAPVQLSIQRFHRPLERDELASVWGFLEASKRLVAWVRERAREAPRTGGARGWLPRAHAPARGARGGQRNAASCATTPVRACRSCAAKCASWETSSARSSASSRRIQSCARTWPTSRSTAAAGAGCWRSRRAVPDAFRAWSTSARTVARRFSSSRGRRCSTPIAWSSWSSPRARRLASWWS